MSYFFSLNSYRPHGTNFHADAAVRAVFIRLHSNIRHFDRVDRANASTCAAPYANACVNFHSSKLHERALRLRRLDLRQLCGQLKMPIFASTAWHHF
jgi:hypothetical protein